MSKNNAKDAVIDELAKKIAAETKLKLPIRELTTTDFKAIHLENSLLKETETFDRGVASFKAIVDEHVVTLESMQAFTPVVTALGIP